MGVHFLSTGVPLKSILAQCHTDIMLFVHGWYSYMKAFPEDYKGPELPLCAPYSLLCSFLSLPGYVQIHKSIRKYRNMLTDEKPRNSCLSHRAESVVGNTMQGSESTLCCSQNHLTTRVSECAPCAHGCIRERFPARASISALLRYGNEAWEALRSSVRTMNHQLDGTAVQTKTSWESWAGWKITSQLQPPTAVG